MIGYIVLLFSMMLPFFLFGDGAPMDYLSAQAITPSTRQVVWQAGRLDGKPERADSEFIDDAFGKEAQDGDNVQIAAELLKENFPQRLLAGQKLVVELPDMVPQNLLFRALTGGRGPLSYGGDSSDDMHALQIQFNDKPIWGRRFTSQHFMIHALIPATYMKSSNNTIGGRWCHV